MDEKILKKLIKLLDAKVSGKNYKALCPFHKEKTPSFMINPSIGKYHCFGCGDGGGLEYLLYTLTTNERTEDA